MQNTRSTQKIINSMGGAETEVFFFPNFHLFYGFKLLCYYLIFQFDATQATGRDIALTLGACHCDGNFLVAFSGLFSFLRTIES